MAILFLLLVLSFCAQADSAWKAPIEALDKVYSVDNIRIFYTLQGADALSAINQADSNKDGVPDYVARVGAQLNMANYLYAHIFGLAGPLDGERYRGKAQGIDVHIRKLAVNGTSGDGVIEYRYANLPGDEKRVISIELSNALIDASLTPAHELFHTYQNGYTMFKNAWFTEGTARWAEYAFQKGVGPEKTLPQDRLALDAVLRESYDAKYFWNRLFSLCDSDNGHFTLPRNLPANAYAVDLVKDDKLHGYSFIKVLLEQFRATDNKMALVRGYKPDDWREQDQRSEANNPYLLCAIKQTISKYCSKVRGDGELAAFLSAIDQYSGGNCAAYLP